MGHPKFTSEEIVRRGQALYYSQIQPVVEPDNQSLFVAIDIETGHYELGSEGLLALRAALAVHPGAALYLHRIGYEAAYDINQADLTAQRLTRLKEATGRINAPSISTEALRRENLYEERI
jgi:hypothetical protein